MSVFQAVARQTKVSGISDKENNNSNSKINNRFNNLSNTHFSNYVHTNNLLHHNNQKNDSQLVEKHINSNIQFNFANIQTKLKVSQPGDVYEQEADRIAEQVMKISDSESYDYTRVDRKCKSCQEEEENQLKISRKENSYANSTNKPRISEGAEDISNTLSQSGSPLDSYTREFMESRFGYDFGNVRIHNDRYSAESTRSINALAYTVGNDVVFGEGAYSPATFEGRTLLAHELTHVIQQTRAHSFTHNSYLNYLIPSNSLDERESEAYKIIASSNRRHLSILRTDEPMVSRVPAASRCSRSSRQRWLHAHTASIVIL